MNKFVVMAVSAMFLTFVAGAMAQTAPAKPAQTSLGMVLADAKGMTLYIFDNDKEANKSACSGGCATNWPPLLAAAGAVAAGDWTIITRDDGTKQWAYKGKPLYGWVKDTKAGDTTGDGVGGNWHVAKP